jgi:hypothetical protein
MGGSLPLLLGFLLFVSIKAEWNSSQLISELKSAREMDRDIAAERMFELVMRNSQLNNEDYALLVDAPNDPFDEHSQFREQTLVSVLKMSRCTHSSCACFRML